MAIGKPQKDNRPRVLVAQGQTLMRQILARALVESEELDVTTDTETMDVCQVAESLEVDVVVLDEELIGTQPRVVERLTADGAAVLCLALDPTQVLVDRLRTSGVDLVVAKAISLEGLVGTITRLAGRRQTQGHSRRLRSA